MEKRKLKLDEIKVESFITSLEGMHIGGGRPAPNDDGSGGESVAPSNAPGVYCGSYEGDPPVWDSNACNSSPYPCGGDTGTASYPCATAAATCANSCGCSYGCSGYGSCQCAGNTGLTVCYC